MNLHYECEYKGIKFHISATSVREGENFHHITYRNYGNPEAKNISKELFQVNQFNVSISEVVRIPGNDSDELLPFYEKIFNTESEASFEFHRMIGAWARMIHNEQKSKKRK